MEISATTSFADPPRPDVVVVPGGFGQAALMKHPLLLDHPRAYAHTAGRRASVCTGALVESLRQPARAYG
ncbi:MAG: hypothetical protein J2P39_04975 [Candidatus Dormibacteraeota bacterium]|nr:hypothetical protein [Candidatus Dormibacteraeota bacterium]